MTLAAAQLEGESRRLPTDHVTQRKASMPSNSFNIDKRAIAKMTREIQREFDRNPVRIPVEAEAPVPHRWLQQGAGHSTIYNGPVFMNSTVQGAQLAWQNDSASQVQGGAEPVATGFEALAELMVEVLQRLPGSGLAEADMNVAVEAGEEVLKEVTAPTPDPGRIRRAVAAVKGTLISLATGAAGGAAAGVSSATEEWAQHAIEQFTAMI